MFRNRSNYRSFGKQRTGYRKDFGRSQGGYSNRFKRGSSKRIDVNSFIHKAKETVTQQIASTSSFSDYNLIENLTRNINEHGYISPTMIQEKTIPHIISGLDVIGIANTGTGKTAAFLIPLIHKAFNDRNERVLIVTPTRELAIQIIDEFRIFSRGMNLEAALCIGGANMRRQEDRLRYLPNFIVGTPGRLKDLIRRNRLQLSIFNNVVLDEVDRMVDIGFIADIKYFISLLPEKRQSLFFSATVSQKVNEILQTFVTNPVKVSVKSQDTADNIDQDIIRVNGSNNKQDILHDLLRKEGFDKVLIFGRTKWGVEKLTRVLIDKGFKAASIHGNKTQWQRQRALEAFRENEVRILLATDVASRGLDIDNVTHVINYDVPESYDDYVHRIGRTGRAGKKGIALTFVE
ncbi:DEAD/DEAH box helicase [Patescibacteria group bacterium]|nr:DEAD/DEAH box helicase [Patescibacteria group bacterium]MBU4098934.1 DEAD/DEAH box helicase [Patescibacteria group bacterium]